MKTNLGRLCILLILLVCIGKTNGFAQQYTVETIPNPKQTASPEYVSNPDRILSDSAVNQINTILGRLEDSTTAQVAVVCVNSIGDLVPKDFAIALFRKWGLGYQKKNNGLLILLVNDQHRIEMETGYGLEGVLPDAVCKRIQTEDMVPAAKKGDFDSAVLAGVTEVSRLISEPEAAQEVYDNTKFESRPLEDSAVFVLFLLLIPCLFALRAINFLTKRRNPVSDQLEKTISKAKMRGVRAFMLYIVLPLCLGFVVISLRAPLALHGFVILLIIYSYMVFVAWEARQRRLKMFDQLFGSLNEPERYSRRKAIRFNGWDNIIFFPIPFAWLKIDDDRAVDAWRNHPRELEGVTLAKVPEAEKASFLSHNQQIEDQIKTVAYDVWRNETQNVTEVIGYENFRNTEYERCDKCGTRAMHLADYRILSEATTEREGRGAKVYECKACNHQRETQYKIAKVAPKAVSTYTSTTYSSSGSSSSSWSSGSSSSSSSSSSWGGGSSGGGGAGSSW